MKKWMIVLVISFLVVIFGYASYLYMSFQSTLSAIHIPIEPQMEPSIPKTDITPPITLLLLGIDNWETTGRADTVLLLTLNPQTETTKMLSIPRDSYTEMVGLEFSDKINHSYSFGGIEMTHSTVENLLQIPIDYVVTINMDGFIELIDILGGIEVENELAFTDDEYEFPAGVTKLSGEEALVYVRMRKDDPQGDFGRQIRQQLVVKSILQKASSLNTVWQAPAILKAIRENVETNLTYEEIKEYPSRYKPALNNVEQLQFNNGTGKIDHGIYYYYLDTTELEIVRNELKSP